MSSRKRGRKPKQQRLTFEPTTTEATAAGTSATPAAAHVRFSSPPSAKEGLLAGGGGPSARMARTKKKAKKQPQQQTLETTLGTAKTKKQKKQPATEDGDGSVPPLTFDHDVKVRRRRVAAAPPPSSFMPKTRKGGRTKVLADSDSESSVEEEGRVDDSDGEGPLKQETPRRLAGRTRKIVAVSSDSDIDEDDSDDRLLATPRSSMRRRRPHQAATLHDSEDDKDKTNGKVASSQSLPNQAAAEDDSDNQPLVTPRSSMPQRRPLQAITLNDSDDDDEEIQSPAKRRRLGSRKAAPISSASGSDGSAPSEGEPEATVTSRKAPSSPSASEARSMRSKAPKRHRTEKEKRMQLLRRRRAGEKNLTMEDLESSSDEDDEQGALYDTDSELEVLEVFDDESEAEQEQEEEALTTTKKGKEKAKKAKKSKATETPPAEILDEDANTEDEDFIDDEDDTIGVPDEALAQIPLEFTRASRKPLKAHFKDAIEWLVHRKINPAFDRDNEVYVNAWRRLSDEVTGLANSKFVSSVWRPDFYKALRARPYIVQQELGAGFKTTEFENCQACGRSGHPATWSISFHGKPYDNKTLDEVESDSEASDEEGDRDAEGNRIPPEDKQFYVGHTCNSNAGTAHNLIHWRPALRDWVDDRLAQDGWMAPDKIVAREKMKAKKRHKVADDIVELWDQCDILKGLFLDFKNNIDTARNTDPAKVARGARRW